MDRGGGTLLIPEIELEKGAGDGTVPRSQYIRGINTLLKEIKSLEPKIILIFCMQLLT